MTRLKTQITRQMAAGMNQKQIRDKVWNAYGEAYVMALAEGNTSTARQLAGLMLNTGAGLTAEEVPQKAVNKAHSIYENSVESGDLNTARAGIEIPEPGGGRGQAMGQAVQLGQGRVHGRIRQRRICRPGKEPGKHGILPENHQRVEGLKEGGVLRPRLFCYPELRRWNGWA